MLNKLYYTFVLFLSLIFILPLLGILSRFDINFLYLIDFFKEKYNLRLIYISFLQAFLSSFLSCILAIPFALSLHRRKKGFINKIIISLAGYSFVLPAILIVYSVIGIFGTNGIINKITNIYDLLNIKTIFGLQGILIAHVLLNTPFATRIFFQNLNSIPKNYIDVAKSMNFNFWQCLIFIEWPTIKQNFITIFTIIFILCFLSFAIVMSLGGGPSNSNLEVAIYQSIFFELNFDKAIILSFLQIFLCSLLLIIGGMNLKGSNYFDIQIDSFEYLFSKNKIILFFDYLILVIFSVIFFSPIFFILINFFKYFIQIKIFYEIYIIYAFFNSLILSISTSLIVSICGLTLSLILISVRSNLLKQQILFFLSSMIIVISPIIISLGFFIILGEWRYLIAVNYVVVILINCIFILPFAIVIFFVKLKNIYLNYEDLKKSFLITDINFFRIIFPLIKKNILFVFSFSFALSFGDFTIISFFKKENFQTLPTLLYKLISTYRFEEATFVAGFILIFSLLIYLLLDNKLYNTIPDK